MTVWFTVLFVWVVLTAFRERIVLILDVQFHEYLSITIFTLISFDKDLQQFFSFILLGFRELPMVSLILHIAPLLVSLDSSLDSFCSRLACEDYIFIYMFILCICIYIYMCIYEGVFIYGYVCICLDVCIYPHKYIILVTLVRMSSRSFAAPLL